MVMKDGEDKIIKGYSRRKKISAHRVVSFPQGAR
jgi:hypothetical protein